MTGYQEILTDPSYAGQIVTLTYPHIGNVGVNAEDVESTAHLRRGTRHPRPAAPARRTGARPATSSAYLRANNIVGIADIDTRKLTRILREKGAQNGCIVAAADIDRRSRGEALRSHARARRRRWRASTSRKVVSCSTPYDWTRATWALGPGYRPQDEPRFHVVAYDFGIKHNILRMLAERGCRLTVVPAQTPAAATCSR